MNGFQRVNKPLLKKITHTNLNNPSLNSMGMQGVFYTTRSPPLVRDELPYHNPPFRDSLERQVQDLHHNRYQERTNNNHQTERKGQSSPINGMSSNVSRLLAKKNEVLDKVNRMPMEVAYDRFSNYSNTKAIKNKQMTGYNIISNF